MRVLYIENIPAPYRVDFFNELGKRCDLTVLYESRIEGHRRKEWIGENEDNYTAIFLKQKKIFNRVICPEVCKYIKEGYDRIIIAVYNTLTSILAMEYMKFNNISFIISIDGGMIRDDETNLRRFFKRYLLSGARYWLSPSEESDKYLQYYGAKKEYIYRYYFTSLLEKDICKAHTLIGSKELLKRKLSIKEDKVVLSVGRFNIDGGYGKGYDTLMKVARSLKMENIGFFVLGDEPTTEFVEWKNREKLDNVHFIGFMDKDHIAEYYAASDIFVLFTRSDVWGLVINEAMAYSLPIITTNKCVAGLELVNEGVNGYIIPVGSDNLASKRIHYLIKNNIYRLMGEESYKKIHDYSIEEMARQHINIFEAIYGDIK